MRPEQSSLCPICRQWNAERQQITGKDAYRLQCARCGEFQISRKALVNAENRLLPDDRWRISAYIQNFTQDFFDWPEIERIVQLRRPSLEQRAAKVLRRIYQDVPPGQFFLPVYDDARAADDILDPSWIALGWCMDGAEFNFLLQEVLTKELGWLEQTIPMHGMYPRYQITAKGILRLENGEPTDASQKGFCAMWFNPSVEALWNAVIEPAIRNCGYEPVRLDKKEYNHSIDDQIIAEIRGSRFLVADLTGHRGGVYYEAGFAHGLGLPVIFMHRDTANPDIHFDLRQYNFILWQPEALEEARKKLENRILATLGRGLLRL